MSQAGTSSSLPNDEEHERILTNIMSIDDDDIYGDKDICRVCRISSGGKLYHPCLCTGSIKYVHQECLLQWLKYSKKDMCELCNHKFSFRPVYREDMPESLPMFDLVKGMLKIFTRFLRIILTYCIVAVCWGVIVPLLSYRIFRMDILWDIGKGAGIVLVFLGTFISVVWLREQIVVGGAPHFMNIQPPAEQNANEADEPTVDEVENSDPPVDENIVNPDRLVENQLLPAAAAEAAAAVVVVAPVPRLIPGAAGAAIGVQPLVNLDGVHARAGVVGEAERIVDDFTWQRLLGFDGTFAFIEHVFWTISLNVVFDVVFLYWPAQIGGLFIHLIGYSGKIAYFELPITVIFGYLHVFVCAIIVHKITKLLQLRSLYNLAAIIYLMLKVLLLIFLEVGLFPVICGCWLDICSLPLTGATLESRIKYFEAYPSCSMFLHWLCGMIYVFYSASFILVLRELLRPGVLWFIRNLNDPEFNPVLEMIQQSLARHFRRLVASTMLFFTIILLVVYTPLRLIQATLPSILPYQFSLSTNTPVGEISLELFLLQIILPSILEYSKAYTILKKLVRLWCRVVGGWLKLDSYLLSAKRTGSQKNRAAQPQPDPQQQQLLVIDAALPPVNNLDDANVDEPDDGESDDENGGGGGDGAVAAVAAAQNPPNAARWQPQQPAHIDNNHLGARHQALLVMREKINFEKYDRPDNFSLRIVGLLVCLSITAILVSGLFFVVPVCTGRVVFYYLGIQPIHDLYTISIGLYIFWIMARLWLFSRRWIRRGWENIQRLFKSTAWLAFRLFLGAIPLIGVIPLMLGIYFQLLVISPLRVSINQTAMFFTWKEWAMGVVHFKIFCASVLMGPDSWLKTSFEEIYANGVRNFELKALYVKLVFPIINIISFKMAYPYVLAKLILMTLDWSHEDQIVFTRYAYPSSFVGVLGFTFVYWQWKKLRSLTQKIRNEKYLVGTQLVNFYKDSVASVSASNASSSSASSVSYSEVEQANTSNEIQPNEAIN